MAKKSEELVSIVTKFAESGWDLLDAPAKKWLAVTDCADSDKALITAIKQAVTDCGSCGCEMDTLYKKALVLLAA
ncbi:MAG: hypothetical protein LBC96_00355 [Lachnospiraceae bacterium]|nr:hypothetical protein [Lachnospiraceae bacterium]